MSTTKALEGIRVVDFGQLTAGANTSAMLADLGADVIKVESGAYMDLFRAVGARDTAPGWWNRSPQFRFTNRNKRGVALDLKSEEGRRLVFDLIRDADVVVENFRRGVLERLGLTYAALAAANPRIVLASISSQGESGPNRMHASFGSTLDATGGMAALTGYADGPPAISGMDVNYPDQIVSLFATGIVIAAVREAKRTGKGAHLDLSQREITSFLIGEEIMAAAAGLTTDRQGNAQAGVLLQDCFRAADGRWVAVSVADDAAAARLPAGDIGPWIASRPAEEAAATLAAAGIPAAVSLTGLDLLHRPDLWGHTLIRRDDASLVKGMPYAFGDQPLAIRCAAPDLGQHTEEVLADILGLKPAEIDRLKALGVTRAEPNS